MKRSRHDRTVAEKLDLLDQYKALPPLSQREAAKSLGVTRGFLQNLLKNETAMRSEDVNASVVKRKRAGKDEEVEKALFACYKFMRNVDAAVSGPILMHTANAIAEAAGHDDFKATSGWLSRWKRRHGVSFNMLKAEAAKALSSDASSNKKQLADNEPEEMIPSVADMKDCLQCLTVGLHATQFEDIDMFNAIKAKIEDHLRNTFLIKHTATPDVFS